MSDLDKKSNESLSPEHSAFLDLRGLIKDNTKWIEEIADSTIRQAYIKNAGHDTKAVEAASKHQSTQEEKHAFLHVVSASILYAAGAKIMPEAAAKEIPIKVGLKLEQSEAANLKKQHNWTRAFLEESNADLLNNALGPQLVDEFKTQKNQEVFPNTSALDFLQPGSLKAKMNPTFLTFVANQFVSNRVVTDFHKAYEQGRKSSYLNQLPPLDAEK